MATCKNCLRKSYVRQRAVSSDRSMNLEQEAPARIQSAWSAGITSSPLTSYRYFDSRKVCMTACTPFARL